MLAREVLNQRPSEADVHDLNPPADGEGGQAPFARALEERQLGRIALGMNSAESRMGLGAVARGIDILATGEYESRHDVEDGVAVGAAIAAGERRDHDRGKTCAVERREIRDAEAHADQPVVHSGRGRDCNEGVAGHDDWNISYGPMFEHLRRSWQSLLDGSLPPDERREVVAAMKDTLVQARVGVSAMRDGLVEVRARLDKERIELATCSRRKQLAQQIGDAETVAVAAKFELVHQERCSVLERKYGAQEAELALAEREVAEMTLEFKYAASGAKYTGAFGAPSTPPAGTTNAGPSSQPGAPEAPSSDRRSAAELDAELRLAELKRRMGK